MFRPRASISSADINQISLGIVCHAVPDRPAAPKLPPFTRPCFGSFLQRGIFEGFGRVARYRIKAPRKLPCIRVVCRKKPADRKLRAADSNNDLSFGNARGHGNGVIVLRIGNARFPYGLTRLGVQGFQSAVDNRCDDFPLIYRKASIHNAATDFRPHGDLVDFRIPSPAFFPRTRVDGKHNAPVRDSV